MSEQIINPLGALICLCCYGLLIFTLNITTLYIEIRKRKHLTYYQYPLLWILGANSLVGVLPLPLYGLKKYEIQNEVTRNKICGAWRFSYFICTHFSIASVLIMVLERFFTVSSKLNQQPLAKKKKLLAFITTSFWLIFGIFDTIPFFIESEGDKCPYTITASWSLILHVVTFLIPNSIISCCYIYICCRALLQRKRIFQNSRQVDRKHSKFNKKSELFNLRATKQFIAIVGSYIVCKLPADLYYTLEWECPNCIPDDFEAKRIWLTFFLKLLVMSHALAVPIIFFWKSSRFRREVIKDMGFAIYDDVVTKNKTRTSSGTNSITI